LFELFQALLGVLHTLLSLVNDLANDTGGLFNVIIGLAIFLFERLL
jgi:hypothetical protein